MTGFKDWRWLELLAYQLAWYVGCDPWRVHGVCAPGRGSLGATREVLPKEPLTSTCVRTKYKRVGKSY